MASGNRERALIWSQLWVWGLTLQDNQSMEMLAGELFKTASLMALEASFQSHISTAICIACGKSSSSFGMVAYSQARCVFKITVKLLRIFLKTSKMTSSFKNNAAFVGLVRLKEKEQTGHQGTGICMSRWLGASNSVYYFQSKLPQLHNVEETACTPRSSKRSLQ